MHGCGCGLALAPRAQVEHLDDDRERHREVDVALRHALVEALARSARRRPRTGTTSASILIDGCADTKRPMAPANTIMRPTDTITAATMTAISFTMPTAVMIESSENTRSMMMICKSTAPNVALTLLDAWPSSPSVSWWISIVLFHSRNSPPRMRIRSRPEISWPSDREQRRGQPDQPGQHEQEPDAHEHREEQADAPRELAPLGRQLVDQDRDEDDVVDAEHELERGQRGKGDPGFGTAEQLDHATSRSD